MLIGGLCYTVGTGFLFLDQHVRHFHATWHLCVIAGSAFHYFAILIFVAAVAHQGARVGRKTYLVDLATAETRSSYTAVSNTVLGLFLLGGGLLGVVDALYGGAAVLLLLLATCLFAILFCLSSKPVD